MKEKSNVCQLKTLNSRIIFPLLGRKLGYITTYNPDSLSQKPTSFLSLIFLIFFSSKSQPQLTSFFHKILWHSGQSHTGSSNDKPKSKEKLEFLLYIIQFCRTRYHLIRCGCEYHCRSHQMVPCYCACTNTKTEESAHHPQ